MVVENFENGLFSYVPGKEQVFFAHLLESIWGYSLLEILDKSQMRNGQSDDGCIETRD